MRFNLIVIALCTLAATVVFSQSDVVLGSTVTQRAGLLVPVSGSSEEAEEPLLESSLEARPQLSVFADNFELGAEAKLAVAQPGSEFETSLSSYELRVVPTSFLLVSLGRFHYRPGMAEFLSNSNFYERLDATALLEGRINDTSRAGELLQARVFLGSAYVVLTTTPFVQRHILPATDSPWFPDADIPETITSPPPFGAVIPRGEVSYENVEPDVPLSIDRLGYSVELGGFLAGFDLSTSWYNGWDNSPLLTARITIPSLSADDPFSVALTPVYRKITAVTASARRAFGRFVIWTDNAYTFYKRFLTNRVDIAQRTTQTAEAPYLQHTGGVSATFGSDVLLLGEYRLARAITDEPVLGYFLDNAALLSIQKQFFDYRFTVAASGLMSLDDYSTVVLSEVSYAVDESIEIVVGVSTFVGPDDSELGQFGRYLPVRAGLILRF